MNIGNYISRALEAKRLNLIIIVVFAVVFSLISLVNHYMFRTNAYDLGIFNHALYDYSQFRFNKPTLILGFTEIDNLLADHFSILQMIFAPLRYIFGTYTLLIVQIVLIFIGAWGIKRYVSLFTDDYLIPLLAQVHFFVSFGVIAALGFDYHDSVMAAMFVPHLLYFSEVKNWRGFVFMSALLLMSRVELAIWLLFICGTLIVIHRNNKLMRNVIGAVFLFALVYFVIVIKIIIPSISSGGYTQFNFGVLGDDIFEAFIFSVSHPIDTISFMFQNQYPENVGNGLIKKDFYNAFLISGGFLMIFRPAFIIMLFPVVAQRMLHDSAFKWGVNGHYSIESVVLISMAAFSAISLVKGKVLRRIMAGLLIISATFCTGYFWKHRHPAWLDTTSENFLKAWHYEHYFDVKELHSALKLIPASSVVSAQSNIVPHLSFRDKIYLYPYMPDAEYVVLNEKMTVYPMTNEDYFESIENFKSSTDWEVIYDDNYTYIFKRK